MTWYVWMQTAVRVSLQGGWWPTTASAGRPGQWGSTAYYRNRLSLASPGELF